MCPDLVNIVNGALTFTGNSVGDTATYTCNSGFELIGNASVTCTQVDANIAAFSPAAPVCRREYYAIMNSIMSCGTLYITLNTVCIALTLQPCVLIRPTL